MPAARLNIDYIEIHSADAVACDSEWQRLLESAMRDSGVEVNSLLVERDTMPWRCLVIPQWVCFSSVVRKVLAIIPLNL